MIQRLLVLAVSLCVLTFGNAYDAKAQPACGNEGQPGCGIFRSDCVSRNLKIQNGVCVHPNCGRDGERACDVLTRIPSCDIGLVEAPGAVCRVQGQCGAEGQRVCLLLDAKPACNPGLVASNGVCVRPNCGALDQRACTVDVRIPSCDPSLVEFNGTCRARGQCGDEGQRQCLLGERAGMPVTTGCSVNLIPRNGVCTRPACGRAGEVACTIGVRVPSCDDGLIEAPLGRCAVRGQCGAAAQRACVLGDNKPACDAGLVNRNGTCERPNCGALDQRACTVDVRIPSCDQGLVEFDGMCHARGACGAEGQRRCLAGEPGQWEALTGCNVGLIVDQSVCLRPQCGREGERACSFFRRFPSCDKNLVEKDGRCVKSSAADCGGERQRACDLDERLPSCRAGLVQDGKFCRHEFDVEGACILSTDKGPLAGNLTKPLNVRRGEREELAPLDQGMVRGSCRNTNGDLVETQIDPTGCVDKIFADWSGTLRCSKGSLPDAKGHYRKFCPQPWMDNGTLRALCITKADWVYLGDYYYPPKFPSDRDPPANHRYDYRELELKDASRCAGGVYKGRFTFDGLHCAEAMPEGNYLEKCVLVAPSHFPDEWVAMCSSDIGVIEITRIPFSEMQTCNAATVNKFGKLVCTKRK